MIVDGRLGSSAVEEVRLPPDAIMSADQNSRPTSPLPEDVASCHAMLKDLLPTLAEKEQRIEQLKELVGALIASNDSPRVARRNDPCPCGSGLKFKRCCAQKSRR
jgi:uncharacterized protein YecA (UPF0149 family)